MREVYAHTASYIEELSFLLNMIQLFCYLKKFVKGTQKLYNSKQKKSQTPLETWIEGREIMILESLIKMEFLNLTN